MSKAFEFTTPKGTTLPLRDMRGKPYLDVQYRLIWFREEKPDWRIQTEAVQINEAFAIMRATVSDTAGNPISMGTKQEHKAHFADYIEKAETGAIGRALGILGYGTQFAVELDEEDRIVDTPPWEEAAKAPAPKSPVEPQATSSSKPSASVTPISPKPTPSSLPKASGTSAGKVATPLPSTSVDEARKQLDADLLALYRPYVNKYPDTNFGVILADRYQVKETRMLSTEKMRDFLKFLQDGLLDVKPTVLKSKPPTATERMDLWEAAKANGWTADELSRYIQAAFGVLDSKNLRREQFQLLQQIVPKITFQDAISEFSQGVG